MTLHPEPLKREVGVRKLHDRLSRSRTLNGSGVVGDPDLAPPLALSRSWLQKALWKPTAPPDTCASSNTGRLGTCLVSATLTRKGAAVRGAYGEFGHGAELHRV
jgi:hypothetical protein